MSGSQEQGQEISLDQWHYIEVDSQRAKHGDWADPAWLKYFGLDMMDVTGDNFKDIVAGRYFYRKSRWRYDWKVDACRPGHECRWHAFH